MLPFPCSSLKEKTGNELGRSERDPNAPAGGNESRFPREGLYLGLNDLLTITCGRIRFIFNAAFSME